jgi:tetratricopeptide (TPR) repeat protein
MQAEDYLAAISAYETAIKLDVTYWAAHSNLIVCHLKLFNIDECLKGCGYLLEKFIGLQKNNQMTAMTERIRAKIFLRQLCCLAYKGELKNFREAGGYLINEPSIEAVYKERLAEDMKTVEQREELLTKKVVFDGLLKSGNNVDAKIGYESLLSDYGPNERIYSNLSLCQVMQGKFEEATQTASDGLNLVEKHLNKNFGQSEQHKQNDFFKQMKIKFFYKRAQAHSGLNEVEKAEKDLGSVLVLDDRNEEARTMKRKIARKRDYEEGMRLKKSGDEAVQLEKPSEALGFYRQCLEKLTVSENLMEYLAVLSNMTVCQGRLEQTDEVISTCMKGLRVTSKHSKSTIMLEGDKLRSEDLEKLLQMELRFHIRKGNAFLKNGQIYHAKAAFEEAIKLAPDNQEIKQGLAKASFL